MACIRNGAGQKLGPEAGHGPFEKIPFSSYPIEKAEFQVNDAVDNRNNRFCRSLLGDSFKKWFLIEYIGIKQHLFHHYHL